MTSEQLAGRVLTSDELAAITQGLARTNVPGYREIVAKVEALNGAPECGIDCPQESGGGVHEDSCPRLAAMNPPLVERLAEEIRRALIDSDDNLEGHTGCDADCGLLDTIRKALRSHLSAPVAKETRNWPGEWCARCDRRNVVGFNVSDAEWSSVIRGRWNVVCLACFDEEAQVISSAYEVSNLWPTAWFDWIGAAPVAKEPDRDPAAFVPPVAQEVKSEPHPDDCQCPVHATLFERCCSRWPHSLVIPCEVKPEHLCTRNCHAGNCEVRLRKIVELAAENFTHTPVANETPPEVELLREMLKESNELLRSACAIAAREGAQTNWTAFREKVAAELRRQHVHLAASAVTDDEEDEDDDPHAGRTWLTELWAGLHNVQIELDSTDPDLKYVRDAVADAMKVLDALIDGRDPADDNEFIRNLQAAQAAVSEPIAEKVTAPTCGAEVVRPHNLIGHACDLRCFELCGNPLPCADHPPKVTAREVTNE